MAHVDGAKLPRGWSMNAQLRNDFGSCSSFQEYNGNFLTCVVNWNSGETRSNFTLNLNTTSGIVSSTLNGPNASIYTFPNCDHGKGKQQRNK